VVHEKFDNVVERKRENCARETVGKKPVGKKFPKGHEGKTEPNHRGAFWPGFHAKSRRSGADKGTLGENSTQCKGWMEGHSTKKGRNLFFYKKEGEVLGNELEGWIFWTEGKD